MVTMGDLSLNKSSDAAQDSLGILDAVYSTIVALNECFACAVCCELLTDPVSTKCGHKYCRKCILKALAKRGSARCPVCKESFTRWSLLELPSWKALATKAAQLMEAYTQDVIHMKSSLSTREAKEDASGVENRLLSEDTLGGMRSNEEQCVPDVLSHSRSVQPVAAQLSCVSKSARASESTRAPSSDTAVHSNVSDAESGSKIIVFAEVYAAYGQYSESESEVSDVVDVAKNSEGSKIDNAVEGDSCKAVCSSLTNLIHLDETNKCVSLNIVNSLASVRSSDHGDAQSIKIGSKLNRRASETPSDIKLKDACGSHVVNVEASHACSRTKKDDIENEAIINETAIATNPKNKKNCHKMSPNEKTEENDILEDGNGANIDRISERISTDETNPTSKIVGGKSFQKTSLINETIHQKCRPLVNESLDGVDPYTFIGSQVSTKLKKRKTRKNIKKIVAEKEPSAGIVTCNNNLINTDQVELPGLVKSLNSDSVVNNRITSKYEEKSGGQTLTNEQRFAAIGRFYKITENPSPNKPTLNTSTNVGDPYTFVGSQATMSETKIKGIIAGTVVSPKNPSAEICLFDDLPAVDDQCTKKSAHRNRNVCNKMTANKRSKSGDGDGGGKSSITDDADLEKQSVLIRKISDAEEYDLIFTQSQRFKNTKHDDATRNDRRKLDLNVPDQNHLKRKRVRFNEMDRNGEDHVTEITKSIQGNCRKQLQDATGNTDSLNVFAVPEKPFPSSCTKIDSLRSTTIKVVIPQLNPGDIINENIKCKLQPKMEMSVGACATLDSIARSDSDCTKSSTQVNLAPNDEELCTLHPVGRVAGGYSNIEMDGIQEDKAGQSRNRRSRPLKRSSSSAIGRTFVPKLLRKYGTPRSLHREWLNVSKTASKEFNVRRKRLAFVRNKIITKCISTANNVGTFRTLKKRTVAKAIEDSSDTDDVEMQDLTQSQFEAPDLAIQPESVRTKLSQLDVAYNGTQRLAKSLVEELSTNVQCKEKEEMNADSNARLVNINKNYNASDALFISSNNSQEKIAPSFVALNNDIVISDKDIINAFTSTNATAKKSQEQIIAIKSSFEINSSSCSSSTVLYSLSSRTGNSPSHPQTDRLFCENSGYDDDGAPMTKRKRKTFSLVESPESDGKATRQSIAMADSMDINQIIEDAAALMLGKGKSLRTECPSHEVDYQSLDADVIDLPEDNDVPQDVVSISKIDSSREGGVSFSKSKAVVASIDVSKSKNADGENGKSASLSQLSNLKCSFIENSRKGVKDSAQSCDLMNSKRLDALSDSLKSPIKSNLSPSAYEVLNSAQIKSILVDEHPSSLPSNADTTPILIDITQTSTDCSTIDIVRQVSNNSGDIQVPNNVVNKNCLTDALPETSIVPVVHVDKIYQVSEAVKHQCVKDNGNTNFSPSLTVEEEMSKSVIDPSVNHEQNTESLTSDCLSPSILEPFVTESIASNKRVTDVTFPIKEPLLVSDTMSPSIITSMSVSADNSAINMQHRSVPKIGRTNVCCADWIKTNSIIQMNSEESIDEGMRFEEEKTLPLINDASSMSHISSELKSNERKALRVRRPKLDKLVIAQDAPKCLPDKSCVSSSDNKGVVSSVSCELGVEEVMSSDDESDGSGSPLSRTSLVATTPSGNCSSGGESELLTTQLRTNLEDDVKIMEDEIARLEAQLQADVTERVINTIPPSRFDTNDDVDKIETTAKSDKLMDEHKDLEISNTKFQESQVTDEINKKTNFELSNRLIKTSIDHVADSVCILMKRKTPSLYDLAGTPTASDLAANNDAKAADEELKMLMECEENYDRIMSTRIADIELPVVKDCRVSTVLDLDELPSLTSQSNVVFCDESDFGEYRKAENQYKGVCDTTMERESSSSVEIIGSTPISDSPRGKGTRGLLDHKFPQQEIAKSNFNTQFGVDNDQKKHGQDEYDDRAIQRNVSLGKLRELTVYPDQQDDPHIIEDINDETYIKGLHEQRHESSDIITTLSKNNDIVGHNDDNMASRNYVENDLTDEDSNADIFSSQSSQMLAVPQTPETPRKSPFVAAAASAIRKDSISRTDTTTGTSLNQKSAAGKDSSFKIIFDSLTRPSTSVSSIKNTAGEQRSDRATIETAAAEIKTTCDKSFSNEEEDTDVSIVIGKPSGLMANDQGDRDWTVGSYKKVSRQDGTVTGVVEKVPSTAIEYDCYLKDKSKKSGDPFPLHPEWVLAVSGINRSSGMPDVEKFALKLGSRVSHKFTHQVSHLLVKPIDDRSLQCQRTLKYFQAVANKLWVVSIAWAVDSIAANRFLPVENYEIRADTTMNEEHFGPRNARLSTKLLLSRYEVCCLGTFHDITRDDLHSLAEACGASTVLDPGMFTFDTSRTQVIVVEDSATSSIAQFKKLFKKYCTAIVVKEWLLDTIGTYHIKSLDSYSVCAMS